MKSKLIKDYQNLHMIPEVAFHELKTQKYILKELRKLNCKIYKLKPTGIIAFFNQKRSESIAFRAELDALNITEENNVSYRSKHPGYMHACAHDGHMAILLELARRIKKKEYTKNIVLIFQPSEEEYGGSLKVLSSRILDQLNVKEIYALHLWPELAKGIVASSKKTLFSSATELNILVRGKSAHIANKNEGIDAIKYSQLFLDEIKENNVILGFGKIIGRGARNIVCSEVLLEGSLRCLNDMDRIMFLNKLYALARSFSIKHNVSIYIDSKKYIPPVVNNEKLFTLNSDLINQEVNSLYQAEDFSFYQSRFDSLYFLLGINSETKLHTPTFNFDLEILDKGVSLFMDILGKHK